MKGLKRIHLTPKMHKPKWIFLQTVRHGYEKCDVYRCAICGAVENTNWRDAR